MGNVWNGNAMKIFRFFVFLVILSAVGAGAFYVYAHRNEESTDDAMMAASTVTVSAKSAGYVKVLNIRDNQAVKAGDVLLEIDPADYITRRDRAQAALEAAQAAAQAAKTNAETTGVAAPSNLEAAQAQLAGAQAAWDKATQNVNRMKRLSNEARSQDQLEQAVEAEKTAQANLDNAQAKVRAAQTAPKAIEQAQATSDQLAAQVKQAQADLAQAENDLANTKIIAPMDGRIAKRGVERGNYVQTGQAMASLVGTDLWVVANFKETQLRRMRAGQAVAIKLDAYPDVTLSGKIDSIQAGTGAFFSAFPPENATGNFVKIVQRVPVKIVFDSLPDPALALGPGMSVEPTVMTGP